MKDGGREGGKEGGREGGNKIKFIMCLNLLSSQCKLLITTCNT